MNLRWFAFLQPVMFDQHKFGVDLNRLAERLSEIAPSLTTNRRARGTGNSGQLSISGFEELVTALEELPCMVNAGTRAALLRRLRPEMSAAIPHHPQQRAHVVGILRMCLNYERGIIEFLEAMSTVEQGSVPYWHLLDVVGHQLPEVETSPDLRRGAASW